MPRSVICCTRPVAKSSHAEVKARRLAKKHTKEHATCLVDREQHHINAGTRLKGVAQLRVRQATPIRIQLSLEGMGSLGGPIASSGWQAIRRDEPDACSYALEELQALHPDFWVYDWQG
jgi:TRAP-type C4-dicarboxylate transport system substrate-binding protein